MQAYRHKTIEKLVDRARVNKGTAKAGSWKVDLFKSETGNTKVDRERPWTTIETEEHFILSHYGTPILELKSVGYWITPRQVTAKIKAITSQSDLKAIKATLWDFGLDAENIVKEFYN